MKCEARHRVMPGLWVGGMLWSGAALMRRPDTERAKTNCFRHYIIARKQRLLRTSHARGIVLLNLARSAERPRCLLTSRPPTCRASPAPQARQAERRAPWQAGRRWQGAQINRDVHLLTHAKPPSFLREAEAENNVHRHSALCHGCGDARQHCPQ